MNRVFRKFLAILLIIVLFFTSSYTSVLASDIMENYPVTLPIFPDENYPVTLPSFPSEELENSENEISNEDINFNLQPKDVTDLLLSEENTIEVLQDNIVMPSGSELDYIKPIKIDYKFKVPVQGDSPTPAEWVNSGDYALFEVPKGLKFENELSVDVHPSGQPSLTIGKLELKNSGMKLTFTDLVEEDIFNVYASFYVNLRYSMEGEFSKPGNHNIYIYDKTYTVTVPEQEPIISGEKKGIPNIKEGVIDWTIKVQSIFEDGLIGTLLGYTFEDNLKDVGDYVNDSFKLSNDGNIENATIVSNGFSIVDNTIKYEFQKSDGFEKYLHFKTTIPDDKLFTNNKSTIKNIAYIKKQNNNKAKFEKSIEIQNNWITKEGNITKNDKGRFIDWTIDINSVGYDFKQPLLIEDKLPNDTKFISAKIQSYNGTDWIDEQQISQEPPNYTYQINNINKPKRLIIHTEIDKGVSEIGQKVFENTAILKIPNVTKSIKATNSVTLGINPLTKGGNGYNSATREINWNVVFHNPDYDYGNDLRILDLLVYGDNKSINFDNVTVEGNIIPIEFLKQVTPSYYQSYVESSFNSSDDLELEVLKVLQDGNPVADLLIITGPNTQGIPNNKSQSFNFKTLLTDPKRYAINGNSNIKNTAILYNNDQKLFEVSGTQIIKSVMIEKDMISVQGMKFIEENGVDNKQSISKLNSSGSTKNVFNYDDKSIMFRIHINNNSTNLEHLGAFIVEDLFPSGWEIKNVNDQPFLLYEGVKGSEKLVNATRYVSSDEYKDFLKFEMLESENKAQFTFDKITRPYVIAVKIGPKNENVLDWFSKNKTYSGKNTAYIYNDIVGVKYNDWEDFSFKSEILNKKVDISTKDKGYLTWNIEYKPYNINRDNIKLKDTLPYGLDLIKDNKTGDIVFGGEKGILLKELVLQEETGNYIDGNFVSNIEQFIIYNDDTRTLELNFPQNSKGYRLTYRTEITGNPGTIRNHVVLEGLGQELESQQQPYEILQSDVDASLKRGARFGVEINDQDNNPIKQENVEISLLVGDDKVLKQIVTDKDGKANFRAVPEGSYTLKVTSDPPIGFIQNNEEMQLEVIQDKDGKFNIIADNEPVGEDTIDFIHYNKNSVGNLKVSKTVIEDTNKIQSENNKYFEFTLTLENNNNYYDYKIYNTKDVNNSISNGKIKSGEKFKLKHNEFIVIENIPKDTPYEVVETDYTSDNYHIIYTPSNKGTINIDKENEVNVVNTLKGMLSITKEVEGLNAELDREFDFKLTIDNYDDINNNNNDYLYEIVRNNVPIKSGRITESVFNFKLAHNDTIYIILPLGANYIVEEDEKSLEDYSLTTINETSGTVNKDNFDISIIFKNTKIQKGNLKLSNEVKGEGADLNKDFKFKIELNSGKTFNYESNRPDNLKGEIKNGDIVTLKSGEYIIIKDIPENIEYKITEDEELASDYEISSENNENVIIANETVEAKFINIFKAQKGNLKLSKEVKGEGADLNKDFKFKIELNSGKTFNYESNRPDNLKGEIKNGDVVTLKNGEYIIIKDIPQNVKYKITEDEELASDYEISSENNEGTIIYNKTIETKFTNTFKKVDDNENNSGGSSGGSGSNSNSNNTQNNTEVSSNGTTINQDNNNIIEVVKDEEGNIIKTTIKDEEGNVIETITDEKGNIVEKVIDKEGNIIKTTIKDKEGNVIETVTDEKGNIVEKVIDKEGNIIKTTIKDKEGNIVETVTDEKGNIVEKVIDEKGNIIKTTIKDEEGNVIETITDEKGNIVEKVIDKEGNIIKTTIKDKEGNIVETVTDEKGNIVEKVIDEKGNIIKTTIKDKEGNVIETITDEKGNIVEKTQNKNYNIKSDNEENNSEDVKSSIEKNDKLSVPKTGDDFDLLFYLKNILISSIILVFLLYVFNKRKN